MTKFRKTCSNEGEKAIIKLGLYVAFPINLNLLLTQSERDVLNVIRHCNNMSNPHISLNTFRIMTGMSTNTIKKARDNLIQLGLVNQGNLSNHGTIYTINYENLYTILEILNSEMNPINRLSISDDFRDKKKIDRLHESLIKEFKSTEYDADYSN